MRVLLGLSIVLIAATVACGDDPPDSSLPQTVEVAVGSSDFANPEYDALTIAVKAQPDPGRDLSMDVAIVDERGAVLAAFTENAPSIVACPPRHAADGWRTFTFKGVDRREELLEVSSNQIRVVAGAGSGGKKFVVDIPDELCYATE